MLYYLIIAIQIICAYHVYKTKNNTYWYYLIILVPGIGCLIYVLTQILNKSDVAVVQKELTSVINPSKRISDLEEQVTFADTFQNRLNLADALKDNGDFANAELQYQEALLGSHAQDFYANAQLLCTLFEQEKFEEVIAIAETIRPKADFDGSRSQFLYGLALSKTGKEKAAEEVLKKIDQRYSNYPERLELVKFYIENSRKAEATEIMEEMKAEYVNLTKPNKKKYKNVFSEIDKLVIVN